MKINLHIERLILNGLPIDHGQDSCVKSAVEAELERLLAVKGLNPAFRSSGAVYSVKADGIQLKRDSSPADLGLQVARAVYGGIGK